MRSLLRFIQNSISIKKQDFKPVVLVTGCSTGVGLALAHLLWTLSEFRVVVTARASSLTLLEMQGFKNTDRFWMRALDVNSLKDRTDLIDEISEKWGGVNVLINNAGVCVRAVVEHTSEENELMSMQTNYFSPMALIKLVLPNMRKVGRGKIINVSSVSGIFGMPTMASYTASKHALEGASEALWHELKSFGINVSIVRPGFIHSNSIEKVISADAAAAATAEGQVYNDIYASITPFVKSMMGQSLTSPLEIAKSIIRIVKTQNPPLRISVTEDALIFQFLRHWMPDRMFFNFLHRTIPGSSMWGKDFSSKRIS